MSQNYKKSENSKITILQDSDRQKPVLESSNIRIFKSRLKAYLELIRYPLFTVPIVSTLPGVVIAGDGVIAWKGYIAIFICMIGYFSGMIKNDYFHSKTDAIVSPNKPIPSGRIKGKSAFFIASAIYIICVLVGFLMNYKAGLLVILLVVISHLYNATFKGKGILGSIVLPLGIATMSIFGAVAVSGKVPSILWYGFAGVFLYDFGAHIATTFKDIDHDKSVGIVTTPIQVGVKPALFLSTLATILAFIVLIIPYISGKAEANYLIWLGVGLGVVSITRIPLLFRQTQENGYVALKGSLISELAIFPCLIGAMLSIQTCALIILTPLILSSILLEISTQKV